MIIEIEAENTIEEIGIMIGIMIEIIETETEILIDLATMIRGVEEGHVLDQGIVAEIMTGIGVMIGTKMFSPA